jgi:hypothetical protein
MVQPEKMTSERNTEARPNNTFERAKRHNFFEIQVIMKKGRFEHTVQLLESIIERRDKLARIKGTQRRFFVLFVLVFFLLVVLIVAARTFGFCGLRPISDDSTIGMKNRGIETAFSHII